MKRRGELFEDRFLKTAFLLSLILHLVFLFLIAYFRLVGVPRVEKRTVFEFVDTPSSVKSVHKRKKSKYFSNKTTEAKGKSDSIRPPTIKGGEKSDLYARKFIPDVGQKESRMNYPSEVERQKRSVIPQEVHNKVSVPSKEGILLSKQEKVKRKRFKVEPQKRKLLSSKENRKKEKSQKRLDIARIFSDINRYMDFRNDLGANKTDREGMISFDSEEFKYAWYARIIKHKVIHNWFPPYAAKVLGVQGVVVVTFKIESDGQVKDIKVQYKSGNESLDLAAVNAIYGAKPFPPLPSDYRYKELGVRFLFGYNVKDFSKYYMDRG